MFDHISDKVNSSECDISRAGHYTARFVSSYGSLHRATGFKTADDAQAWIARIKLLDKIYC